MSVITAFDTSSLTDAIMSKIKQSPGQEPDRTFDVGSKLSSLVAGGFDKLGYIPLSAAVKQCDGMGRYRVEKALERLRSQAELQLRKVGQDIESRCRGYVEFAANNCGARIRSLATQLETTGKNLITDVQDECRKETTELVE